MSVLAIALWTAGWLLSVLALAGPDAWLDWTGNPVVRRLIAAAGAIGFAVLAYELAQRKRHLLLAKDRLQLVEGNRVLGQLPYDNIARIEVEYVGRGLGILVLLHDYHRPDTTWNNPPGFHDYFKKARGFDLYIAGFREYAEILRNKIRARCRHTRSYHSINLPQFK